MHLRVSIIRLFVQNPVQIINKEITTYNINNVENISISWSYNEMT